MKPLILAIVIGAVTGIAASQTTPISHIISDIFPKDAARRQALSLCILADPSFNRLDSAARDQCYRHALVAPAATDQRS
jgi:hypothetical protein